VPAYLSVHFDFDPRDTADLVRRFYASLATAGAPFGAVLPWGCDARLSLDEIIAWNQAKLAIRFRLGYAQHVSNDYRQILLDLPPFSHARVFVLLGGDSVGFSLIVPESEVDEVGTGVLERVARSVWAELRPRSIQTMGELGAPVRHGKLLGGAAPSAAIFSLLHEQYPLGRPGADDEPVPEGTTRCGF